MSRFALNATQAAAHLGVSRRTFYRRWREHPDLLRPSAGTSVRPQWDPAQLDSFKAALSGAAGTGFEAGRSRTLALLASVREGKKEPLSLEECARIFPAGRVGIDPMAEYVALDDRIPPSHFIDRNAPAETWRDALATAPAQAPVRIAVNQTGMLVEVVEWRLAVAAIDADSSTRARLRQNDLRYRKRIRVGADFQR